MRITGEASYHIEAPVCEVTVLDSLPVVPYTAKVILEMQVGLSGGFSSRQYRYKGQQHQL